MPSSHQRVWVAHALIGLIVAMFLGLAGRLIFIQDRMRPELMAWTHQRLYSEIPIPGRRGHIYDRKHRMLAGSHDTPTIFADPYLIEDKQVCAERLAEVMPLERSALDEKLRNPTSPRYVVLMRKASRQVADAVRDLKMDGIGIRMEPARDYPQGGLGAHVLGFVGADGRGLEGVEWTWGEHLKATNGKRVVFRGAGNRAMFQERDSYQAPKNGNHVILTIDAAIQETVENAVAEQVAKHAAESGVGIVMDCRTGEVLAMASVPTFEPAAPGESTADARRNRVLTDPEEPGSIFKPFVMAIALTDGVTHPDEVIFCENGLFIIGARKLQDHHAMGNLTATEIIARSSNIGMAKLGLRLGNARMHEALSAFGFNAPTGIDLPGESEGLMRPLKKWGRMTTTSVPMGHEIAVTPIQLITAFSAIMNGGILVQPRVVAAVVDHRGQVIENRTEVIERGRAISEETARTVRGMLAEVVNHKRGTGRRCQLDQWQVMGKTGTAEVPHRGGYSGYLASFIAGAPADEPRLSVLVMIRRPKRNGYYGSQAALPAVKKIFEMALPYLDVPPDEKPPEESAQIVMQR